MSERALSSFRCAALFACTLACADSSTRTPAKNASPIDEREVRTWKGEIPGLGPPAPLVIVLHGYSIDGEKELALLPIRTFAREKHFVLTWPDGTRDKKGYRFWNATDACCNFHGSDVDDVRFLENVIDHFVNTGRVDPKRVYLLGHSNGAFMAHRFACERSSKVAAIATLAGVTWNDPSRCQPSEGVSVLHIQGSADPAISPAGGRIDQNPVYPSAEQTVLTWSRFDGCTDPLAPLAGSFDYDAKVPGAETTKRAFGACARGTGVELWTMRGSGHEPGVGAEFVSAIYDFFMAHPKP